MRHQKLILRRAGTGYGRVNPQGLSLLLLQAVMLLVQVLILVLATSSVIATKMGSADCSWQYYTQPLSHFARALGGAVRQRLCIYEGFWDSNGPVFFYTGNESPVEEYCDNNGFIWDLAEKYSALVVFAEHRLD